MLNNASTEMLDVFELERAVVVSLLRDSRFIYNYENLTIDVFTHEAHKQIVQKLITISNAGQTYDIVSLKSFFSASAADKELFKYILSISDGPGLSRAAFGTCIEQLRSISQRRQLITVLNEFSSAICETDFTSDSREIIGKVINGILSITGTHSVNDIKRIKPAMMDYLNELEKEVRFGHNNALFTSYRELDLYLDGIRPGQLIIVGARPAMGKTSFALNLALRFAQHFYKTNQNREVYFLSLEMARDELMERLALMLGYMRGLNFDKRQVLDNKRKLAKIGEIVSALDDLPLSFSYSDNRNIDSLCFSMRAAALRGKVGVLFVDYLQLVDVSTKHSTRTLEVAEVSRKLKALAMDLNIPIIALAQVSRALETRQDKRPVLSDLRESGNLEQDADVVMFLHREEYYLDRMSDDLVMPDLLEKKETFRGKAEIIISKNRRGASGSTLLKFIPHATIFEDL